MRVPARVYASKEMLLDILDEKSVDQLVNVATLAGIQKYALAMPDIHQGYGFPIGGVAAFDVKEGIISPGGVGYDINCGIRLLTSNFRHKELKGRIENLANQIQRDVPSGVGRGGRVILDEKEMDEVLNTGIKWAIKNGHAKEEDAEVLEENGYFKAAKAELISDKAKRRGKDQAGTLGAGNHFIEMQVVHEVFDEEIAEKFKLFKGQVVIMIHTGSRGLGHQVCTDYVKLANECIEKYKIDLPDRELAYLPFNSPEGQKYFQAMAASANFAWVNRQIITKFIRGAFKRVLGESSPDLSILYDIAHNIAKQENHGGKEVIVHRKGATRAFGPGNSVLPLKYKAVGQPVFIPGSMGTCSYILAGAKEAMNNTFGSTCHGAGRRLSRMKAKKMLDYNQLRQKLNELGIIIRAGSAKGLLEEAPEAYKNVSNVVDVVCEEKITKKVVKLKPLAIVKG